MLMGNYGMTTSELNYFTINEQFKRLFTFERLDIRPKGHEDFKMIYAHRHVLKINDTE